MATYEELMASLREAHASGDIDRAKVIAAQARAARAEKNKPLTVDVPVDLPSPQMPAEPVQSGFVEQLAGLMVPSPSAAEKFPRTPEDTWQPDIPFDPRALPRSSAMGVIPTGASVPPPSAPVPSDLDAPPAMPAQPAAPADPLGQIMQSMLPPTVVQPPMPAPTSGQGNDLLAIQAQKRDAEMRYMSAPIEARLGIENEIRKLSQQERAMSLAGQLPGMKAANDQAIAEFAAQNYTPLGEAISTELGNTPERVERGLRGNALAWAEQNIIANFDVIGRTKQAATRLQEIEAKKAEIQAGLGAPSQFGMANQLAELDALDKEAAMLSRIVNEAGLDDQIIDRSRGQIERSQRLRNSQQADIDELQKAIVPTKAAPGLNEALVSGIASMGDMAPGLAASIVTQNPLPMMAYLGAYSRGSTYADKRADGASSDKALTAANLYALAEAIPEALPLHVILKGGVGALSKVAGGGVTEAASEALTQALQIMIDKGVLDEDTTWAEAKEQMAKAAAAGGVMGVMMGGVGAGADVIRNSAERRRQAKGTPADPNASPPPRDVTAAPPPSSDPMADLVKAMTPQAAPKPEQAAPVAKPAVDAKAAMRAELVAWAAKAKGAAIPSGSPAARQMDDMFARAKRAGLTDDEIDEALSGKSAIPDPMAQITAAMTGQPAPTAAPQSGQNSQNGQSITRAEAEANPDRYEIIDEAEGQGANWRPTGAKVVVDKQTGQAIPLAPDAAAAPPPAAAGAPGGVDSAGMPQAAPDQGNGGAPAAAGPAPEADVVAAAGGTTPPAPVPNQPRSFEFVDAAGVQNIETEPDVMQYKAGGDSDGVTDRLRGVAEWIPERAGISIIYEYADGRRVIADGHQRLGLAKRLAAQGKPIQMPAMILRQVDGVTPEDARVQAALKNIAEGSGTALDAAKVLRGSKQTPEQLALPPNSAMVRDAMGMKNLSDQAFGMVVNGVSSERDGGIVGRVVTNKDAQANILGLLARMQKDRPITAFQAEQVAKQAAADTVTETQDSLFGPETDTKNLYLERAKILEAASKMKREEQAAFKNVIANADRLAAAGNQLDAEGNQTRLDSAAAMRDYLNREANTKGAISEALTTAARALNGGATIASATRQFLDAIEKHLASSRLEQGQRPGSGGGVSGGDQGGATPQPDSQPEPEPQAVEADRDDNAAAGDLFGGPAPDPVGQIVASMTGQAPAQATPPDDLFGATPQTGKTPDQVRAEAEAEARKNQGKIRKTGGNDGDAGPLFGAQPDLLASGKQEGEKSPVSADAEKPASDIVPAPKRMTREEFAAETKRRLDALPPAADHLQKGDTNLVGTKQYEILIQRLSAVDTLAERSEVADKWVLEFGTATNSEHMVGLDKDGFPLNVTRGKGRRDTASNKGYSVSLIARVYLERGTLAYATHNHPRSTTLSPSDAAQLALGITKIVAVGNTGSRSEAVAGPKMPIISIRGEGARFNKLAGAMSGVFNILAKDTKLQQLALSGQISHDTWDRSLRAIANLAFDRMGLIDYKGDAAQILADAGINFGDIYDRLGNQLSAQLRRAGFSVTDRGDRIRDTARDGDASGNTGPAGSQGGTSANTAGGAGNSERNPQGAAGGLGPVKPPSTGNADLDGALDDIFGDKSDVPSTSNDMAGGGRDGASSDGMGAGNVPAAPRPSGRGTGRRGGKTADGDGKRSASSGLPDGDAPSVGSGSNPGADGSGGTNSQPAASGNGGSGNGGRGGRLSSDTGGKANTSGNASGSTGKLTPAQRLAAIRNVLKEDAIDFVAGPSAALREDPATVIDPRKAEALESIFVGALDGVDIAKATDRELFRSVVMPLAEAGMTRAEVAELTPYLEAFLADLRAGRVNLDPEPMPTPAPIGADNRAELQAAADKIKVKPTDKDNIDQTLPLLLPVQRDDVFKIETRFAKPEGHGFLLTNGTGTGKTYSGAGVAKRFYQAGKTNILIIGPDATLPGWGRTLDALGIPSRKLKDTNDAGEGVVYTTHENTGMNNALANRDWDLVIVDESQKLSSNAAGNPTDILNSVRAITHRPQDLWRKSKMLHADDWARYTAMPDGEPRSQEYRRLKAREEKEVAAWAARPRPKLLMLSATPFAYDKSIDYAEGYLFDYPKDGRIGNSNQGGRELFMVSNFGYRIRYHKLTKPEHAVDSAVFEREFHERLKREGVLSGRSLQVDVDYDRRFVTVADAIGTEIDAILKTISEGSRSTDKALADGYETISKHMRARFGYLPRMQLLEAIKAKAAVDDIKKHLAMGRKVVVFHDFNKGGGFNPFAGMRILDDANALAAMADLTTKHPDWEKLNFSAYPAPNVGLKNAFGNRAGVFSGITKKDRDAQLNAFNTDGSGLDVLIVQSDAGGAGVSMHDITGAHQRVLINLGMPVKPTTTLQSEGRILRVGTKTDAAFRYYTIGTSWERTAFAQRIAERSGTVENLALGNEARAITSAFIDAYMDAETFDPSDADGKGGKEKDRAGQVTTPWQKAIAYYFGRMKTTGRRDHRQGLDFYPTPEPLGLKMVEWAGIRPNERVLEPSAGDGAVARFMPDSAAITLVEPSDDLGSTALLRQPRANLVSTTFENHHISNKYHAIVMNPPFGTGGSTAMQHLAKAAKHLRPGGRIVALIPTGPSADKKWNAWWESDDAKDFNLTADVNLPAVAFERAGTAVMTRVVILDRLADGQTMPQGVQNINFTGATTIQQFFDRLEQYDVRRRPDPVQDVIEELEAEGQDAETPTDRKPGPPLATDIGAFEKTTVTSKKGKVFPAAHHAAKVERGVYDQMKAAATALDGWWHKNDAAPKGSGPTFAFRREADRDAFLAEMQKPTEAPSFEETGALTPLGESAFFSPLLRAQMVREAAATTEEITRLMPKLRAELDRLDLKRVKLTQAEGAEGYQGAFVVTGDGEMEIVIGASLDPVKTLHHEVIHALRAMNLFTPAEWTALTLAAERKWLAKHDIAARYPHLTEAERIEEAVAEEFSEAIAKREAPKGSILITAFNKIARLFRALRNVLNGAGYQTPEAIFGRVLAGEISARQAGNTGAQVSFQRKGRDTATGDLFAQPEPARPSGMTADQRRELEARQQQSKMRKAGGNSGDAGPLFNDDRDLFGDRVMFQRKPLAVRPLTPQARAHRNSAMGATPFIPDRRVWESLTRAGIPIWQRLRDMPGAASDAVDRARYTIQDRMLPFLRAQEAVMKQTGRRLPKEHDAYLAETTFSGKVGRHLLEIDEEYTKPIIQIIAKSKGKISADSVGEWLYARHAIERNAYIASINPNMPDGGSGMENIDAAQILADIANSPEAAQYNQIGAMIDALRERNLKLREDAGLISNADAQLWRTQYKHYVPLKGFEETDHYESIMDLRGVATGRRFSMRGAESRRALGRQSEAFNPLQSAITQAQEVAIRSEKNRVAQAMYELAANYPSKALWEVKKPKQKKYFNRTTGLVESRVENPVTMVLEPNEMAVKIGGQEHRILFNDQRLAESAGTLGADQMSGILRVLSMFSRFFSMTRTMLNPEFMITNGLRDFQTAQFNIQAFGENDKGRIAKAMAKNWRKAFLGAMRGSTYRFDTEWSKYYAEFQKAGAQVWFWTMEQPEAARGDLEQRIKLARGNKAQRALKVMTTPSAFFSFRDNAALNFIERTNLAVDNAIRLAAFVEARKAGWDVDKAAFLAKELTVNFNRRGEAGAQMNALYPFFNAAIQGTVRTVKAISSRRVAAMVLTAFAAGAMNDLLNAALSEEDEDGELFYDKVADFRNERNFHMVLWGTGNNPFAIPMPYGYNVFPYAGQQLGKVMRGVKKPEDAFADVVGAIFGAYSPISAKTPAQFISPVISDPVVEMAENKNWLGNPIYPRDYGNQSEPDSHVHFRSASEVSKYVAQTVNSMTGGDFRESGYVDVSPETLDHLAAFVVGSAGTFWGRSTDIAAKALQGDFDSIESRKIPFVRNLTSPIGDWADRDRFYRFSAEVKNAQADKRAYEAAGKPVPKKTADLATLYDAYLAANREMTGKGEWNPSKVGAVAARAQSKVYLDFNGKYLRVMGKQGE